MPPEEIEKQKAELAAKEKADAEAKAKAEAENLHNKRTEKEKAEYSLKKNAERVKELGGEPADVLGIRPHIHVDDDITDDTPLTVGTLRKLNKDEARKTALDMASEITDEAEREEVRLALETRITPSGNAKADFDFARGAINASRNAKIASEAARKGEARRTASGGSMNARVDEEFVPTEAEKAFMRPPYNMTKEKVLAAREKAENRMQ